jgi:hypothetical protein
MYMVLANPVHVLMPYSKRSLSHTHTHTHTHTQTHTHTHTHSCVQLVRVDLLYTNMNRASVTVSMYNMFTRTVPPLLCLQGA